MGFRFLAEGTKDLRPGRAIPSAIGLHEFAFLGELAHKQGRAPEHDLHAIGMHPARQTPKVREKSLVHPVIPRLPGRARIGILRLEPGCVDHDRPNAHLLEVWYLLLHLSLCKHVQMRVP